MDKETKIYPDLGNTEIDEMEVFVNNFLKAVGYPCFNKERVLLESMTEGEYEAVKDFLWNLRHEEDLKNND